ncbi:hypothetical protein ACFQT0_00545 [Hymenobacter humi]|uniref:Uncharacterized protein n=1 Tax=Hymenobacter humi TaxID=1411620 RepID=A0ABW2TZG9_9BACT
MYKALVKPALLQPRRRALEQFYTGFIYEGPALVNQINKALVKAQG